MTLGQLYLLFLMICVLALIVAAVWFGIKIVNHNARLEKLESKSKE